MRFGAFHQTECRFSRLEAVIGGDSFERIIAADARSLDRRELAEDGRPELQFEAINQSGNCWAFSQPFARS